MCSPIVSKHQAVKQIVYRKALQICKFPDSKYTTKLKDTYIYMEASNQIVSLSFWSLSEMHLCY